MRPVGGGSSLKKALPQELQCELQQQPLQPNGAAPLEEGLAGADHWHQCQLQGEVTQSDEVTHRVNLKGPDDFAMTCILPQVQKSCSWMHNLHMSPPSLKVSCKPLVVHYFDYELVFV